MESKVVLITGASEGIGAACAGQLRKKGAKLSLTALPGPGFQDHSDGQELVSAGDITDDGFRRTLVRRTVDRGRRTLQTYVRHQHFRAAGSDTIDHPRHADERERNHCEPRLGGRTRVAAVVGDVLRNQVRGSRGKRLSPPNQ
jgi:NAD(P)-dependent dehydrogenase (short-subunit alcohol dehydrogenase family)